LLTLEKPARTSVDEALVLHDDITALNAAVAANAAAGAQINLPCGTYNITSSVRITVAKIGFSGYGTCSIINGYGVPIHWKSSSTSPAITGGFGTGAAIVAKSGFRAFQIKTGTDGTASSGIVRLPLAVNGWTCSANDLTTHSSTVAQTVQTASTTTSATLANYTAAGSSGPWTAGDVLNVACQPY
jgi:hypothetical protein